MTTFDDLLWVEGAKLVREDGVEVKRRPDGIWIICHGEGQEIDICPGCGGRFKDAQDAMGIADAALPDQRGSIH